MSRRLTAASREVDACRRRRALRRGWTVRRSTGDRAVKVVDWLIQESRLISQVRSRLERGGDGGEPKAAHASESRRPTRQVPAASARSREQTDDRSATGWTFASAVGGGPLWRMTPADDGGRASELLQGLASAGDDRYQVSIEESLQMFDGVVDRPVAASCRSSSPSPAAVASRRHPSNPNHEACRLTGRLGQPARPAGLQKEGRPEAESGRRNPPAAVRPGRFRRPPKVTEHLRFEPGMV